MPQAGKQARTRAEEKWKTVARERAKQAGLPAEKVIARVQEVLVARLADEIAQDRARGALSTEKEKRESGKKAGDPPTRTRAFGRVAQEVLGDAGSQDP